MLLLGWSSHFLQMERINTRLDNNRFTFVCLAHCEAATLQLMDAG